ncbi:hypothetical protein SASPL_118135 [Salvia splendens]|uniref:Kinesin family member C1 n=1 Tax=Salvia splendens TaxID=180675 RepID=A0A8X8Y117_SALSN|nr:hypothetical protein SASPL_118135 [Salvia splendens]
MIMIVHPRMYGRILISAPISGLAAINALIVGALNADSRKQPSFWLVPLGLMPFSSMDRNVKDSSRLNGSSFCSRSDGFESVSSHNAKQHVSLVEWMNAILPDLCLPANVSDEELRDVLIDGSVLCRILRKIKPGSIFERDTKSHGGENVERFLYGMDEMGLPRFQVDDLEQGSMKKVLDCLSTLRMDFMMRFSRIDSSSSGWKSTGERGASANSTPKEERFRMLSSPPFGEHRRKLIPDSKTPNGVRNTSVISQAGHNFHDVFQLKHGSNTDLLAAKTSETMKSNSLDNAPVQSLLSVVNGILDEGVEMKSGAMPHRVACLLRKVVQEIERRICTQADHMRTQNNLYKRREENYQSRIRVLEALATGTRGETQIDKNKFEEETKAEEHEASKLVNEKEGIDQGVPNLRQRQDNRGIQQELQDRLNEALFLLTKSRARIKELEAMEANDGRNQQELENRPKESKSIVQEHDAMKIGGDELEDKKKETQSLLAESRERIKQLEAMNAEIGIRQRELENRFKEAQNLLKESRDRVKELEEMKGGSEEDLKDRLKEEPRARINELEASKVEEARGGQQELQNRVKEVESSLEESKARVKELEAMKVEGGGTQQDLERKLMVAVKVSTELKSQVKELEAKDAKARTTIQELEDRLKGAVSSLDESMSRVKDLEKRKAEAQITQSSLQESRTKVKELEALLKSKSEWWKKKQTFNQIFIEHQLGVLPEIKFASQEIKQEFRKIKESYSEEFNNLAKNYHPLLAENRKLHNELQELKGNIRVYCRIRPFLPGQKGKQSIIEYIGENGELTVANPAKPGKEGRRSFRFDKVYSQTSTQAQVFADTQPLIQSVLDGFNVCIFAYGQTGSGKTYTMTGPDGATEDEWGVNYRALKNLFTITQDRGSILQYEVSVQMVEPNGLAVPDASIEQVKSTEDVMRLMDIGLQNRAKSSTAMNERSSRSHSIVSIHTRGTDLKSGSSLRGSLHLVDLAGSERVDRSDVTGDRLKEAQHINKSLSALGDVVFALSQKAAHVPYRNSKLTQVLQSSLGGHAKTLMFVQMNPDATSFSETLSTLKFAERVSGVELGAAKSNKDNMESHELMDQVATLRESLAKKEEEIEALQKQVERKKSGFESVTRPPIETIIKAPSSSSTTNVSTSVAAFVVLLDLQTKRIICRGHERGGLYYLDPMSPVCPSALSAAVSPYQWQCHLGHPSSSSLRSLVPVASADFNYESCELGKHHRTSYPSRVETRSSSVFDLVHCDVWGPSRIEPRGSFKYFLILVDDYFRMTCQLNPTPLPAQTFVSPMHFAPPLLVYTRRHRPATAPETVPNTGSCPLPQSSSPPASEDPAPPDELPIVIRKVIPTSYQEALKHSLWRAAMDEKMRALLSRGTWILIADIFTKPLPMKRFSELCTKLDMINIYDPA